MIIGYATPGKQKSVNILDAFCHGRGHVVTTPPKKIDTSADAAFFGVTPATKHLWDEAVSFGIDTFYLDNAYIDSCRGTYFRATKNRLQAFGNSRSTADRWEQLKLPIHPWRTTGNHILVCPQSDEFMSTVCEYPGNWTSDIVQALARVTKRPIRVRPWNRDKAAWFATLDQDLADCWCVVTYSSSSALSALRAGVPAICTAYDCIAASWIEARPDQDIMTLDVDSVDRNWDRRPLFHCAASNQWSLTEMRDGTCWRMMNG